MAAWLLAGSGCVQLAPPPSEPLDASARAAVAPSLTGESTTAIRTVFQGGFGPDLDRQLAFVAERHQLWVLSGGASKVTRLREANRAGLALRYMKIGGIHGPETRPPGGDPDWAEVERRQLVARDEHRDAVRNTENGWYYVDLLDPGRRAEWSQILIARLRSDLEGYDGVMLDNSGVVHTSLMSARPSGYSDAAYFDAVHEVLREIRAALPGKLVVFNSYAGFAAPELRGPALLDVADGLYFEGFSFKVTGQHFNRARLAQQVGDFAAAARAGKITVALDYADPADLDRRMFSLGAFLLAAGERSYHFFSAPKLASSVQEFPEQTLDLGEALGPLSARPDGLLSRRYERALVLLNADDQPITFDLVGSGAAERLRIQGGGAFPAPGSLTWEPTARRLVLAPTSAAIVR